MRLRHALAFLAFFTTITLSVAPAGAQQRQQAGQGRRQDGPRPNAALRYWQAFAHLPKLEPAGSDAPDGAPSNVIEAGKDALLYLRRGASIGPCDWGLYPEDGPYLLLPHLAKGRDLSRLACMKVRLDFAAGRPRDAVEAGADAIVLGRHLGSDVSTMISYLVQLMVERSAIETIAEHLAAADPAALDALDRRLAALPPGGSLEACLKVERDLGIGWAVRELRRMNDNDPWQDRVVGPFVLEQGAPARDKVDEVVSAAGGSREAVARHFESLLGYYDELGPILRLPREQFRARLAELVKRQEGNPLAKPALPAMDRFYDNAAAGPTRVTMLKAAVAVLRGGPERAKEFKDATGAPLQYHATDGGFELRSSVVERDKPVTLKVAGRR